VDRQTEYIPGSSMAIEVRSPAEVAANHVLSICNRTVAPA